MSADATLLNYVKALWKDWITGMCGGLSVPFAGIAVWVRDPSAKLLWGCLAVLAFFVAGYRVWRDERNYRIKEIEALRQEEDRKTQELTERIRELQRKPYSEELARQVAALIGRLSPQGVELLRHLFIREPITLGQRFLPEINQEIQDQQLSIAYGTGIVRYQEVRPAGHLLRTEYVVNPQFRAALQDLLFEAK
jgi:hypothetical protein